MDNVLSDWSNPPTPEKIIVKEVVNSTDESAAISEGALKDAKNYISGIYGKNKNNFLRKDPFDYVDQNEQYNYENNAMVKLIILRTWINFTINVLLITLILSIS